VEINAIEEQRQAQAPLPCHAHPFAFVTQDEEDVVMVIDRGSGMVKKGMERVD